MVSLVRMLRFMSVRCRWLSVLWAGAVVVGEGEILLLLYVLDYALRLFTRRVGIRNVICSPSKRAIPNTGIDVGDGPTINAIASVSKGFDLGTSINSILIFAFVNCRPVRCGLATTSAGLGIHFASSSRLLSRMIMMNCNMRGGDMLSSTIDHIADRRLSGNGPAGVRGTLGNGISNMRVVSGSNRPNTRSGVHVQNANAIGGSSPLCVMSNVPSRDNVDRLGPSSVRSVRILGSTTSTTVCKTHNTGNIMLVAAGGNAGKGTALGCRFACNVRGPSGGISLLNDTSCRVLVGRVTTGTNGSPCFPAISDIGAS